jgi:hypothetical protein
MVAFLEVVLAMSNAEKIHIDVPLVRRLITTQFPEWADLPINSADGTTELSI